MSPKTLHCAECGVELATADAEDAVKTDAGPVHRECFDGPVPPPAHADDLLLEAEEEARRDHGDVPLPRLVDWKTAADLPEDADPDAQAERYRQMMGGFPAPEQAQDISVVDGVICADDRTARRAQDLVREDLHTSLDPDRRS